MPKLGNSGTSLDRRYGNPETVVYRIKTVTDRGDIAELVFPVFDKDKALRCLMQLANSPDMSFVSIGKEQG